MGGDREHRLVSGFVCREMQSALERDRATQFCRFCGASETLAYQVLGSKLHINLERSEREMLRQARASVGKHFGS